MQYKWLQAFYYKHLKYFLTGRFDELLLVFYLFRKSGREGLMIDVGSHFGESAQPFLLLGWTVHGFEPDPDVRKKDALAGLKEKFSGFHLHELAASDEDGLELSFYASDESTGISSLLSFTPNHHEVKKVTTCTLDKFTREHAIDEIDFLKIDTEGNDLRVLEGCNPGQLSPKAILCEFEDNKTRQIGYDYRDLGDHLVKRGYDVFLSEWYPIEKYGIEHQWRSIRRYPCETEDPSAWGNFIALKEEYSPAFVRMLKSKFNVDI